jgi:hypothetical protein
MFLPRENPRVNKYSNVSLCCINSNKQWLHFYTLVKNSQKKRIRKDIPHIIASKRNEFNQARLKEMKSKQWNNILNSGKT